MNFAHSFWSKPLLNCKFNRFEEQLKIILTDYLLSFIIIKDNGYDVTLYTDKIGADILSIINYDHIEIIENSITDDYNFAASIKFCALERMPLEDTLIDGDCFFQKGKIYGIIEGARTDFLCTTFEGKNAVLDNLELCKFAHSIDFEEPFKVPEIESLNGWYNTSVMRFNNQDLKNIYIDAYKKNLKICESVKWNNRLWPDIIIEQFHLTQLLNDYTVQTITPNISAESDSFAKKIGFTHLGMSKYKEQERLENYLRTYYAEAYRMLEKHTTRLIQHCYK